MSTTQHTVIDLENGTHKPSDAVRSMAAQLLQLAADLDAGVAVPQSGAGIIARLPDQGLWSLDLELKFKLQDKLTH